MVGGGQKFNTFNKRHQYSLLPFCATYNPNPQFDFNENEKQYIQFINLSVFIKALIYNERAGYIPYFFCATFFINRIF